MLALAVVLVLLIGEIDLSLGTLAGLCAALLAVLLTNHGWPAWAAIVAALVVGAAAGVLQGGIVVRVGVPSFVVTLGGFLAWQGVQLTLLGDSGELRVEDPFVQSIANAYVPSAVAWLLLAAVIAAWCAYVARAPPRPARGSVSTSGRSPSTSARSRFPRRPACSSSPTWTATSASRGSWSCSAPCRSRSARSPPARNWAATCSRSAATSRRRAAPASAWAGSA